jgi:hypothetical protein
LFFAVLFYDAFLAMRPTKRQQSCHCSTEPIQYPALPNHVSS